MNSYTSSFPDSTYAIGALLTGGVLGIHLLSQAHELPLPQPRAENVQLYVASEPVVKSSTLIIKQSSGNNFKDIVPFGSARNRFSNAEPVRTTLEIRDLAQRILNARAERKNLSSEVWAEKLAQKLIDGQ